MVVSVEMTDLFEYNEKCRDNHYTWSDDKVRELIVVKMLCT